MSNGQQSMTGNWSGTNLVMIFSFDLQQDAQGNITGSGMAGGATPPQPVSGLAGTNNYPDVILNFGLSNGGWQIDGSFTNSNTVTGQLYFFSTGKESFGSVSLTRTGSSVGGQPDSDTQ